MERQSIHRMDRIRADRMDRIFKRIYPVYPVKKNFHRTGIQLLGGE
jgi:hypothetical protein